MFITPFYKSPFSQGQVVAKPNSLVVDVVIAHQAGMVYVMLSRCCSLEQLNILDKMDPNKILVNKDVTFPSFIAISFMSCFNLKSSHALKLHLFKTEIEHQLAVV